MKIFETGDGFVEGNWGIKDPNYLVFSSQSLGKSFAGRGAELEKKMRYWANSKLQKVHDHNSLSLVKAYVLGGSPIKKRHFLGIVPKLQVPRPPFWEFQPFFADCFWSNWKFLGDFKVF